MADILVVGAGGHIGYELCLSLVNEGHQVIALDYAFPEGISGTMEGKPENLLIERCDFSDSMAMREWLEKAKIVFHLGSTHLQAFAEEMSVWSADPTSVKIVVDMARGRGVERFIHVSSTAVYGNLAGKRANEQTPTQPQSAWAKSELAAEQEVLAFAGEEDFRVTVLRPCWVFSATCPRMRKLVETLKTGKCISLGGGQNVRQPLYIRDMIEALTSCITSDSAAGQTLVLAGPKPLKTTDMLKSICPAARCPHPKFNMPAGLGGPLAGLLGSLSGLLKMKPPITPTTLEFFQLQESFDIAKAKEVLGFEPKFSFRDGMKDCQAGFS